MPEDVGRIPEEMGRTTEKGSVEGARGRRGDWSQMRIAELQKISTVLTMWRRGWSYDANAAEVHAQIDALIAQADRDPALSATT